MPPPGMLGARAALYAPLLALALVFLQASPTSALVEICIDRFQADGECSLDTRMGTTCLPSGVCEGYVSYQCLETSVAVFEYNDRQCSPSERTATTSFTPGLCLLFNTHEFLCVTSSDDGTVVEESDASAISHDTLIQGTLVVAFSKGANFMRPGIAIAGLANALGLRSRQVMVSLGPLPTTSADTREVYFSLRLDSTLDAPQLDSLPELLANVSQLLPPHFADAVYDPALAGFDLPPAVAITGVELPAGYSVVQVASSPPGGDSSSGGGGSSLFTLPIIVTFVVCLTIVVVVAVVVFRCTRSSSQHMGPSADYLGDSGTSLRYGKQPLPAFLASSGANSASSAALLDDKEGGQMAYFGPGTNDDLFASDSYIAHFEVVAKPLSKAGGNDAGSVKSAGSSRIAPPSRPAPVPPSVQPGSTPGNKSLSASRGRRGNLNARSGDGGLRREEELLWDTTDVGSVCSETPSMLGDGNLGADDSRRVRQQMAEAGGAPPPLRRPPSESKLPGGKRRGKRAQQRAAATLLSSPSDYPDNDDAAGGEWDMA